MRSHVAHRAAGPLLVTDLAGAWAQKMKTVHRDANGQSGYRVGWWSDVIYTHASLRSRSFVRSFYLFFSLDTGGHTPLSLTLPSHTGVLYTLRVAPPTHAVRDCTYHTHTLLRRCMHSSPYGATKDITLIVAKDGCNGCCIHCLLLIAGSQAPDSLVSRSLEIFLTGG